MALRSDWSGKRCPIARSLDVVGDPWVLLILREALLGTRRYDDFRCALGIADNVLSRRLAGMVEAGLLVRVPYREDGRSRHEYRLTTAGADLLPVLQALVQWGETHTTAPGAGRLDVRHTGCGAVTASADRCDGCGQVLTPETVEWLRPWRDRPVTPLAGPVR
jgi:DNA-binding HxlR family transcriptional regulator